MKIDIHKLLQTEQTSFQPNPERVKARTLARIQTETKPRRTARPLVRILAAAAALAVLATGAFAVSRALQTRPVEETVRESLGEIQFEVENPGVAISAPVPQEGARVVAFRKLEWLPQSAYHPYYEKLSGFLHWAATQSGGEVLTQLSAEEQESLFTSMDVSYNSVTLDPETLTEKFAELAGGLSEEDKTRVRAALEDRLARRGDLSESAQVLTDVGGLEAEEAYMYYEAMQYAGGEDRVLNIRVYSAGDFSSREFLTTGETRIIKEGELGGREALYLEVEDEVAGGRHILLFDPELQCVIQISGSDSFEMLEKIAAELTLVETDIPAENLQPEWHWNLLTVAEG